MLLSVIIPVYNVAKYLPYCVESVLNQEYADIEVILVDDGSTDGCSEICDAYAQTDSRVRVIHKANGGLSSARNAGLDIATGELIAFLDSDDWIDSDTYSSNLHYFYSSDVDVVHFPVTDKYLPERIGTAVPTIRFRRNMVIFNLVEKFTLWQRQEFSSYAGSKIYRKEVWEGLRFPEGMNFEDKFVLCDVLEKCKGFVLSETGLYHYRDREDSISVSPLSPSKIEDNIRADMKIAIHTSRIKGCSWIEMMRYNNCLYYLELAKKKNIKLGQKVLDDVRSAMPSWRAVLFSRSPLGMKKKIALTKIRWSR